MVLFAPERKYLDSCTFSSARACATIQALSTGSGSSRAAHTNTPSRKPPYCGWFTHTSRLFGAGCEATQLRSSATNCATNAARVSGLPAGSIPTRSRGSVQRSACW